MLPADAQDIAVAVRDDQDRGTRREVPRPVQGVGTGLQDRAAVDADPAGDLRDREEPRVVRGRGATGRSGGPPVVERGLHRHLRSVALAQPPPQHPVHVLGTDQLLPVLDRRGERER